MTNLQKQQIAKEIANHLINQGLTNSDNNLYTTTARFIDLNCDLNEVTMRDYYDILPLANDIYETTLECPKANAKWIERAKALA